MSPVLTLPALLASVAVPGATIPVHQSATLSSPRCRHPHAPRSIRY